MHRDHKGKDIDNKLMYNPNNGKHKYDPFCWWKVFVENEGSEPTKQDLMKVLKPTNVRACL